MRVQAEQPVSQQRVLHHVAVGQFGALGLPGGSAGVQDHRGTGLRGCHILERGRLAVRELRQGLRVGSGRSGGRVGGEQDEVLTARGAPVRGEARLAQRQFGRALEAEVRRGPGVREVVGDLPLGEQHVQRHHGRAGLQDAVVDDREARQVRTGEGHLVAPLDAARDQQVRHLVGCGVEFCVRQVVFGEDDRGAFGVTPGCLGQQPRHEATRTGHHALLKVGTPHN